MEGNVKFVGAEIELGENGSIFPRPKRRLVSQIKGAPTEVSEWVPSEATGGHQNLGRGVIVARPRSPAGQPSQRPGLCPNAFQNMFQIAILRNSEEKGNGEWLRSAMRG